MNARTANPPARRIIRLIVWRHFIVLLWVAFSRQRLTPEKQQTLLENLMPTQGILLRFMCQAE